MDIELNGITLHAEWHNEMANRPTLVFLHDSLGCVELWRDFPAKLSQVAACNILVYDRLGYGKSDAMPSWRRDSGYLLHEAKILGKLLRKLEIDQPILFGHSDGGSIALIAASLYPARIKAVIAEAAHIFVEEITLNGIRNAIESYEKTDLRQRLEKYHGSKTDMLFNAWTATWTSDFFRNWSIENTLGRIRCSLLVIQGEADEFGSLAQVDKTVAGVSGPVRKVILPHIGHTPHKENPQVTLEIARDFILSLDSGNG